MERAEKAQVVEALNQVFGNTGTVVVAHYTGLTVSDMTALRAKMREAGAGVRVAKNRLVKRALEGTDVGHIADLFTGPTVIAFSEDPVAAPKVAVEFAKTNEKLVILGGAMGSTSLNADSVKALAALPSLDELRAKLIGLCMAPAAKCAQLSKEPAAKVARLLNAYAEQRNAA